MNTKRSYIEYLNAGRPRREHAALEGLNRSLAGLDERFGRNLRQAEGEQGEGEAQHAWRSAGDFERSRARESGVASMSRIASELNTLREELRRRLEGASDAGGAREPYSAFSRHAGPGGGGVSPYPSAADEHVMAGIADRLEQIHAAVAKLPDSLSISSLEDKVKTLATAVEQLARQKEMPGATTFEAIEERLDEISRAIVASSQPAPGVDNGQLERIEARITSLSRQLEELVEDRPTDAVMKQLSALSARVEDIAGRAELPEATVNHLSRQIDLIVEKLEGGSPAGGSDAILEGMERRFEMLTQALEQRHETAREQSVALFRDLEERLERYNQDALSTDAAIVDALNKRFSDLEDAISRHGGMEAGAVGLTGGLQQPGRPLPEFDDIGPRLAMIERSVNESREAMIAAAREAAEQTVRSQSLPEGDVAVLSGLAEELQSLEKLARRSDERNTRTFEAIHDTLLQIVDRLGALESGTSSSTSSADLHPTGEATPARKLEFADAPSLDVENAEPLPQPALERAARQPAEVSPKVTGAMPKGDAVRDPKRSPAEAAAAAAMAALSSSDSAGEKPKVVPKRSRLGKLSGVLSRKKKSEEKPVEERREPSTEPESAGEVTPEASLDAPLDPKLANRPLEPGSGAPDLNAIMRRVRDARGDEGHARNAETAKSDFIAAARRAAQAAAAEAEVQKKKSEPKSSSGGFSLKRLLRSNTKIVLLVAGVVLVGVAGTQLGRALLRDSGHKTVVQKASIAKASSATPSVATPSKVSATASKAAPKPDTAKEETAMSPIEPLPAKAEASEIAANTGPSASGKNGMAAAMAPAPANPEMGGNANVGASVPAKATPEAAVPASLSPVNTVSAEASPTKASDDGSATKVASTEITHISAPADAMNAMHVGGGTDVAALPHEEAPAAQHGGATAPAAMMPVPDDAGPAPLREAAESADPKAIFEIGSRYAEGRGVASDMKAAAKWYAEAAGLGYAPAEYRIGNFYEKGIGVERDIAKAREWYVKAADQGNAAAMHNLGVLYAMGADGAVDNEAAVRWFEKAAELGVKDSQFNLGILAAKGVGMPQNLEESYKWFALVAKTGDKDAAAKRDEVANSLRPEQLQKARAATELWKARPVDQAANIVNIPDAWKESDTKTASIDMKQAVRNIQIILGKNGYDAGAADGIMGDRTKSAIVAFQKANGMEPTGEVNEALVTALLKKK
ncbi:MAG: peptidoglycan-binding protein [Rhizobiaceae bacterium]